MRGRRRTYGFTIFLLSLFLVCFLIDVRLRPPTNNYYPQYNIPINNQTSLDVNQNVQSMRFYNLFNTTLLHHKDRHLLVTHKPPITTVQPDIEDNTTRINGGQTTSGIGVNVRSRAHFIVIVSYMRSGSTLTGDIMQHFPGAFYIFEPFHSLVVRTRRGQSLVYTNGTKRKLSMSDLTDDLYRAELQKWMECRFEELDVSSLADSFHQYFSRSMRKFSQCWRPKPRTFKSLRECLPVAKGICENAQYRLFKFIRLPMNVVKSVFDFYPNFQIVHLLRDPRGVLMSQIRVNKFTEEQLPEKSREHCSRVANDLNYTLQINKQHPNQIKILLYENLAENPIATATRLYHYIDMPIYEYVLKYVTGITQRGRQTTGKLKGNYDFGVLRGNSTQTAYSWRDVIGLSNVRVIDSNCHVVYNFLGYQTLNTVDDITNHDLITLKTPNSSLII